MTVVKTFAEEQESDLWEDAEFIAELDRRTAEYESGKAKVLTLEELENKVRKAYKPQSKIKAMNYRFDFHEDVEKDYFEV